MDDTEMLRRCNEAWNEAKRTGKWCRVYSRYVGYCGDCSFSYYRKFINEKSTAGSDLMGEDHGASL